MRALGPADPVTCHKLGEGCRQGLAEIETHRLMALLALPLGRAMLTSLDQLEGDLADVMQRMPADRLGSEDQQLLLTLTDLAGQIETLSGMGNTFSASQAYDRLVLAHIPHARQASCRLVHAANG